MLESIYLTRNEPIFNPLSQLWQCALLQFFTLSNARQFYSSSGECCHSMGSIALHPTLYVTLSNTNNFTCQQESTGAQWVNI
jgi:hypothetical protein